MKKKGDITTRQIDEFIDHLNSWVLDSSKKKLLEKSGIGVSISKRNVLKAAGIEPNYYRAAKRREPLGVAASERIEKFAGELGYFL